MSARRRKDWRDCPLLAHLHGHWHIAGPVRANETPAGWVVVRYLDRGAFTYPLGLVTFPDRRAAVRAYWKAQAAGPCGGRP